MDTLTQQLEALEFDSSFTVIQTFKESDVEKTELIADATGNQYVRKYLKQTHLSQQANSTDSNSPTSTYQLLLPITSPYLPKVLQCYSLPDCDVVIMQYLIGQTAQEYIANNGAPCAMPLQMAVDVFREVCLATQTLHKIPDGPIIHRDIKPSNVILTPDGAKLIDFGISRTVKTNQSADTQIWGTRSYAAPEQFGFSQTDERSDIYSLGVLLHFLLTGANPERTASGKLLSGLQIPQNLLAIITRCTQLDPAQRYQTVEELLVSVDTTSSVKSGKASSKPKPKAPTKQFKLNKQQGVYRSLWIIWLVVANIAFWTLFLIGAVYVPLTQPEWVTDYDRALSAVAYIATVLLVFAVPYVLLTNFAHILETSFLSQHRLLKVLLALVIAFILCIPAIGIPQSLHTDEYKQTMAAQQK